MDREHGADAQEGWECHGREKAVARRKVTGEGAGAMRACKGRSALFSRGPLFRGQRLNLTKNEWGNELAAAQANRTTWTGPVAGSTVRAPRGWRRMSRSRRARSGSRPRKRF